MRLIVGLGNPGSRYVNTPHNIGYDVIDVLAEKWNCKFKSSHYNGLLAKTVVDNETIYLLKPKTYMNLSGLAVAAFLKENVIDLKDIMVIFDDINLPIGMIRLRAKGSAGGHKGLKSIIQAIGSNEFPRLRIGILSDELVLDLIEYVLSPIKPKHRKEFNNIIPDCVDAVDIWLKEGINSAMNKYNKRLKDSNQVMDENNH